MGRLFYCPQDTLAENIPMMRLRAWLKEMAQPHNLHTIGWIGEVIGTILVLLDAYRISKSLQLIDAAWQGNPIQYEAWYYHALFPGACFLLGGLLIGGYAVWQARKSH